MNDDDKTKDQLVSELAALRKRIVELEQSESERDLLLTLIDSLSLSNYQIYIKDRQSRFLIANEAMVRGLKVKTADDLKGKTDFDLIPRAFAEHHYAEEQAAMESGEPIIEREFHCLDNKRHRAFTVHTKVPFRDKEGKVIGIACLNRNISSKKYEEEELQEMVAERTAELTEVNGRLKGEIIERKRAEERQKLAIQLLELLNHSSEKADIIREILLLIKGVTGFEAVGVRLREGEDFPYYETNGFLLDFVEAERSLCARDQDGELIRDLDGNPCLECMCGNVICGRTNPSLPFFTESGSFWTNSTTELLASTKEEDRQARTRNRCNGEGYESVALIPLRPDSETIGLLQLNDSRKDMFTLEMIRFFERIGASIGIALDRKRAEERMADLARFPAENPNPVLRAAKDGIVHSSNKAGVPLLNFWECQVGEVLPEGWHGLLLDVLHSGSAKEAEIALGDRMFSLTLAPVLEKGYVNIYGLDITERKKAEEQIKASLAEKVVLLQEIHHRVKNNLQVISSLLDLQSESIEDPQALQAFQVSQNRVKSMALIHERLYQSDDLASVGAADYIQSLADSLVATYGEEAYGVVLNVEVDEFSLDLDSAIPCGLILNELISNALKYAFPRGEEGIPITEEQTGEIRVELHLEGDQCILEVRDNGVGLPSNLDFQDTASLGLQLVNLLTRQLRGTIELDRSNGTAFKIAFTQQEASKEVGR